MVRIDFLLFIIMTSKLNQISTYPLFLTLFQEKLKKN